VDGQIGLERLLSDSNAAEAEHEDLGHK